MLQNVTRQEHRYRASHPGTGTSGYWCPLTDRSRQRTGRYSQSVRRLRTCTVSERAFWAVRSITDSTGNDAIVQASYSFKIITVPRFRPTTPPSPSQKLQLAVAHRPRSYYSCGTQAATSAPRALIPLLCCAHLCSSASFVLHPAPCGSACGRGGDDLSKQFECEAV